jgi:hypothetical protein
MVGGILVFATLVLMGLGCVAMTVYIALWDDDCWDKILWIVVFLAVALCCLLAVLALTLENDF